MRPRKAVADLGLMVLPPRSGLGARAGALLHRGVSTVRQCKRRRLTSSSAVQQSTDDVPR